jgi:hypothetical protein
LVDLVKFDSLFVFTSLSLFFIVSWPYFLP